MRRMMMMLALLACLALAATPALASEKDDEEEDEVTFEDLFGELDDLEDLLDEFDDLGLETQEAESGDVEIDYDISNTGDNANQCVGLQSAVNTGNAQNSVSPIVVGDSDGDGDIDLEDLNASVEVSPSNTTDCNQTVDQNAEAYSY